MGIAPPGAAARAPTLFVGPGAPGLRQPYVKYSGRAGTNGQAIATSRYRVQS